ncbi:Stp1/IreP family PP2C-type Ser/Thr phosphatase [Velocimicrobium porci]|uniref:Stp1/IreP family PP2C-type Ser/Thr phosphatase n=1 Tax=Velocimicrobium porci TaxID=2606634 RepID=A0A6L5XXM5_9FIRM|nr:Stp1/IreP family PP2C-type Ser/Thr phosphatase [Velocimicrobium porci]MSS63048.1 Stp1/IreP family PP2C-type Ser/Thr phosphatase [Velocimicrobium porci]
MKAFSITDVGVKRKINQDYVFCEENAVGSFPNLFIVADGMGGHKAGDYASKTCVETVVKSIQDSPLRTPISTMEEAIGKANKRLYEEAANNSDLEGMGTTFVAAMISDDNLLYVANIGDSRLYIINGDQIKQVTEDHSLVEEMIKNGELDRKDARFHPNKNIITRALGTAKTVVADYFEVPLLKGDSILLCSDGLCNMMDDDDIMYIVRHCQDDIQSAARQLIEKANENGGKDNISIILIEI